MKQAAERRWAVEQRRARGVAPVVARSGFVRFCAPRRLKGDDSGKERENKVLVFAFLAGIASFPNAPASRPAHLGMKCGAQNFPKPSPRDFTILPRAQLRSFPIRATFPKPFHRAMVRFVHAKIPRTLRLLTAQFSLARLRNNRHANLPKLFGNAKLQFPRLFQTLWQRESNQSRGKPRQLFAKKTAPLKVKTFSGAAEFYSACFYISPYIIYRYFGRTVKSAAKIKPKLNHTVPFHGVGNL